MVFIGIQHLHRNQDTVKHADGWPIYSNLHLFGEPGELREVRDLIELAVDLGLLFAEDLALADLEADVAQGPEFAADAVAVVGVADLEQGVGPAAGLGPPVRGLRAGCRRR